MKRDQQTLHIFIIKQSNNLSIVKDEVIKLEDGRFKSIKFRHTYYDRSEFMITIEEVREYLRTKHKFLGDVDNLMSEP